LVVAIVVFSALLPGLFFTSANIESILAVQAVPLILALGVLLPLRCNQFDLSIAQIMVLSGAITGTLTVRSGWELIPAVVVATVCACLCGAVNGLLTVYCGLNSFVVTLGTSSVIGGLLYAITDSQSIQPMPASLVEFSTGRFLGLPHLVWYAWIIAAILWVVLELTPYGRYLLFVGGSRLTSELIGIRAQRLAFTSYVAAALLAAFAGVVLAGSLGTVNPTIGAEFLLTPYAAAFLGAAAIQVGRFNVIGTVLAVYLVAVGQTGLILLGSPPWVSNVFEGAILVAAIGFSKLVSRNR
jgi:ribose transport system permease protein